MRIAVDLHIHSALSPCADDDMTPNNIVNMAILKKLDVISITDHNSCDNVEAVIKAADSRLIVVPGMEVQTREEVHLLCYFSWLDKLMDFEEVINNKLPNISNVPKIFGNQLIIDDEDKVVGVRDEMLISSTDLSIDQIIEEVWSRNGVVIPAHVDRPSYSVISQLGFIPHTLEDGMVEISDYKNELLRQYPSHKLLYSSDAHELGQILERVSFLTVWDLSVSGILKALRNPSK
ncbi:MAG: PHP domain-containing protein [Clostridiales bacterium]|jgi:PHP family Zn ribbon phosphoesterase|nr:PHP domain-containing protein [Clostridiales bacterium]